MAQLRQDRLTREWVFLASDPAGLFVDLSVKRPRPLRASFDALCPLCPKTERSVFPVVRRIPAATPERSEVSAASDKRDDFAGRATSNGMQQAFHNLIHQEVIVET